MPRVVLSCACTGLTAGPPPAAPTAIEASKAIARAAGALRRVLLGVPSKNIPVFCQMGRETSDAPQGGQRNWRSRLGHERAAEYGNSGAVQKARQAEQCLRRQNTF